MLFADLDRIWLVLGLVALIVGGAILLIAILSKRRNRPVPMEFSLGGPAHNQPIPDRQPLPPEELGPLAEEEATDDFEGPENADPLGWPPNNQSLEPAVDQVNAVADPLVVDLVNDWQSERSEDDEVGDEIEVVGHTEANGHETTDVSETPAADELRLALEASQNELAHLTARRDHALSVTAEQQHTIEQLRQRLDDRVAEGETLVADRDGWRQKTAELETQVASQQRELDGLRTHFEEVQQGPTREEHEQTLQEVSGRHAETVNELRVVLGQLEAGQASLAREKQNLAAQLEDTQRRADAYRDQLQALDQQGPSDGAAGLLQDADHGAAHELAALQAEYDRVSGELSLAQESLKQSLLNDEQRDIEIAALARNNQELQQRIATLDEELAQSASTSQSSDHAAATETTSAELEQLSDEAESLRGQLTELQLAAEQRDEETRQRLEQMQSEAAEAQALRLQLETANKQLAELQQQSDEKISYLAHQLAFAEEQAEQHAALTAEVQELRKLAEEHEAVLDATRAAESKLAEAVAENQQLQSSLQELEAQVQGQTDAASQVSQLTEQLDAAAVEIDSIHGQLSDAQQQAASAAEAANRAQVLQEQLQASTSELGEVRNTLTESQSRSEQFSCHVGELDQELQAARTDAATLQAELAEVQSRAVAAEDAASQSQALQEQLQAATSEISDLRGSLSDSQTRAEESARQVEELSQAVQAAKIEAESVHTQLAEAQSRAAAADEAATHTQTLQEQLQATTSELSDVRNAYAESQSGADALTRHLDDTSQQLQTAKTEAGTIRGQLAEAESRAEAADEAATHTQTLQEQLQAATDELTNARNSLAEKESQAEESTRQMDGLSQELRAAKAEIVSVRAELDAAETVDDTAAGDQGRVEELERELGLAASELESLRTGLAEREATVQQLSKANDEHNASTAAIGRHITELEATGQEQAEKMQALSSEKQDLIDQLTASQREADIKAAEMRQLHETSSQQQQQLAELEKLRRENQEYRQSVTRLQASANALEESEQVRQRDRETFEETLREERSSVESARARLREAGLANAELSEALQLAKSAEKNAEQTTLAPLRQELERSREELAAIRSNRDELEEKLAQHQRQIEQLEQELESMPEEKKAAGKAVRQVDDLRGAVARQKKLIDERDQRLQDLASKLGKVRAEATALQSELSEQKAIMRALRRGESTATPGPNGNNADQQRSRASKSPERTAKTSARKAGPSKNHAESTNAATRKDTRLGVVFDKRPSQVDDLKKIVGIGPVIEKRLNAIGIYRFSQVGSWSKAAVTHLNEELSLGGRITRQDWVKQARQLAK